MTRKQRFKFNLYLEIRNTPPTQWVGSDVLLLHHLAVDEEVIVALENQRRPRRRLIKDACSVAGCGCLSFRPKPNTMVYCRCAHLTHDHYKQKRT